MTEYSNKRQQTEFVKCVDKDAAGYWCSRHYSLTSCFSQDGMVIVSRECDYKVKSIVLDRILVISSSGKEGIANLHGDVILPCVYDKVIVTTSTNDIGIFVVYFLAYQEDCLRIFMYDGEKAVPKLCLDYVDFDVY